MSSEEGNGDWRGFVSSRVFCGAAVGLLLLGGCRALKPPPRPVTIVVPSPPLNLFPNTINEDVTLSVLSNVYESLVDLDPKLRLQPGLAESWYSTDETTWIFKLRPDVLFEDGRPLTARDVVASLNHARLDPESRRSVQLANVTDVSEAEGNIVVRTNVPLTAFPARLANVYIWGLKASGTPQGTGPYLITSSNARETVLDASPRYRGPRPPIARLLFRVIPEIQDRVRALEAGLAQMMLDLPSAEVERIRKRFTVEAVQGLRVFLLGLSCEDTAENPFRDVRVRRAAGLAINRSALVAPSREYAQPIEGVASPEEFGGHAAFGHRYDPAGARDLMKEAGHAKGFDVPLLLSTKYRYTLPLVEELRKQLDAVGIRVTPEALPADAFFHRLEERDMTLYLLGWLSDTGDGRVSYDYLVHSRKGLFGLDNGSRYSSLETDGLIEKASRTSDPDVLQRIFVQLEGRVAEDVPLIPLFRQADIYAFTKDLAYTPRLDRRLRFASASWKP
jgi:peptide/nickel transport system substrate-binding protein